MKILTLSGSTRSESLNAQLIRSLPELISEAQFSSFDLFLLPMYHPDDDRNPYAEIVNQYKSEVNKAHAVLITTPEYLANIPAVLKNALEWLKSGGELSRKKVLPITFTPHEPRGDKAMQSLCWSLGALDAAIIAQLNLYHADFNNVNGGIVFSGPGEDLLLEAVSLLT